MPFNQGCSAYCLIASKCSHKPSGILLNTDSDSGSPGWSLKFCPSNKLPGDEEAAGPQTILEWLQFVAQCAKRGLTPLRESQ